MKNIQIKTGARLLETLTSALYSDPIVIFREYVQNAVDSFTNCPNSDIPEISIKIELDKRRIIIADNGNGILPDKFEDAMKNIGMSNKHTNSEYIGFRGIGRLSGLPFCEKLTFVNKDTNLRPVPLHLRNAVTELMSDEGYGKDYKYAHDYEGNFVEQEFMPESLAGTQFYHPITTNPTEQKIAARITELWGDKYNK